MRGENLLAQSYEINLGYPMPRATFMGGVNLNFWYIKYDNNEFNELYELLRSDNRETCDIRLIRKIRCLVFVVWFVT